MRKQILFQKRNIWLVDFMLSLFMLYNFIPSFRYITLSFKLRTDKANLEFTYEFHIHAR